MQKMVVVFIIIIVLILGIVLFLKFLNKPEKTGLPNPASVYCLDQGGKLDIVTEASGGGQIGICNLPNGKSCEEWSFFRSHSCSSTSSAIPK